MELLGTAYVFLLQLVLDRRSRELFDHLSLMLAKQVYQGYGYDLASRVATEAGRSFAHLMTGTIAVSLYESNTHFQSASDVPHSLYSEANASMEAIGEFDHADSEGFLRVLSVSARALAAMKQVARKSPRSHLIERPIQNVRVVPRRLAFPGDVAPFAGHPQSSKQPGQDRSLVKPP